MRWKGNSVRTGIKRHLDRCRSTARVDVRFITNHVDRLVIISHCPPKCLQTISWLVCRLPSLRIFTATVARGPVEIPVCQLQVRLVASAVVDPTHALPTGRRRNSTPRTARQQQQQQPERTVLTPSFDNDDGGAVSRSAIDLHAVDILRYRFSRLCFLRPTLLCS
jgi:hypothetical protein